MKNGMTQLIYLSVAAGSLLISACTPSANSSHIGSPEATFLNGSVVQVPPYTRTIFSSTNF